MNLKIIVCIKQVPDTTNVRINQKTNTLIRNGVESIINPFDMYAIEEGIRIKEKYGGTVIGLSMGPLQAEWALREAISMGIDKAILLSDVSFAGADTLATAYTLSRGIKKLGGANIILMGRQAIDGDTGQVGPEVAENLGIPHVTDVRKIERIDKDKTIIIERLLEEGYLCLRSKLPILLTVVKEINEPRLPSLKGRLNARKIIVPVWNKKDIDANPKRIGLNGSPTQVVRIFAPPKQTGGKIFEGDVKESVNKLLTELRNSGIPIGKIKKGE